MAARGLDRWRACANDLNRFVCLLGSSYQVVRGFATAATWCAGIRILCDEVVMCLSQLNLVDATRLGRRMLVAVLRAQAGIYDGSRDKFH